MAKETMQAVSDAEKNAREMLLRAKEESERLVADANAKGEQIIGEAVKDARKKAEVLCGVARADAEKLQAQAAQQTAEAQAALRQAIEGRRTQVTEEIHKIILGQP